MLESFINLESLLSITFGAIVSFQALKVKVVSNNQSPTIHGDGNVVNYNTQMAGTQKNFKYLWNVLFLLMFVLLPFWGAYLSNVLYSMSFFACALSVIGVALTIRKHGAHRALDVSYVLLTFLTSILAYCTVVNMAGFWHVYQGYYGRLFVAFSEFSPTLANLEYIGNLLYLLIVSFSFVLVFISLMYATFAYIRERDFDEVVKFSCHHFISALIGYVLASNSLTALRDGNFSYIYYVLSLPVRVCMSVF
ncbi:hypothetical protein [Serratia rubidaea]|uniref:hypothetical protein n=1 Tax=Serratia rubidaea TaxID=61652 RepID=UPI0022B8B12C|nr:hypothetical protein [Serratia rubidaea]WBF43948.1 hypothetical protein OLD77_14955 [Serratia rubidaea]